MPNSTNGWRYEVLVNGCHIRSSSILVNIHRLKDCELSKLSQKLFQKLKYLIWPISGRRHRQCWRDCLSPRLPRWPERDVLCRNSEAGGQKTRSEHLGVSGAGQIRLKNVFVLLFRVENCVECYKFAQTSSLDICSKIEFLGV